MNFLKQFQKNKKEIPTYIGRCADCEHGLVTLNYCRKHDWRLNPNCNDFSRWKLLTKDLWDEQYD